MKFEVPIATSGGKVILNIDEQDVKGKIELPFNALGDLRYNQHARITVELVDEEPNE